MENSSSKLMWFVGIALVIFVGVYMAKKKRDYTKAAIVAWNSWGDKISHYSSLYGVPTDVVVGVICVESSADPGATSIVGAKGLMQLMQGAVTDVNNKYGTDFSLDEMYDPNQNILVGTAYLGILNSSLGDLTAALQAYNVGIGTYSKDNSKGASYAADVLEATRQANTIIQF